MLTHFPFVSYCSLWFQTWEFFLVSNKRNLYVSSSGLKNYSFNFRVLKFDQFFTHVFVFENLNSWNSRLDPDFCPGLVSRLFHNCKHTTYLTEGFFKILERYNLSFSQSCLFPDIFFRDFARILSFKRTNQN